MKGRDEVADYVTYKHGTIWEVRCPVCATPIRTMVLDDKPFENEMVNGKVVIRQGMVLACLPNYREVKMAMSDGTFHISPMCKTCTDNLTIEKVQVAAQGDSEVVGDRKPTLAMDVGLTIRE